MKSKLQSRFGAVLLFGLILCHLIPLTAQQWVQEGQDILGVADFNHTGRSVSMDADGNTVAVGTPGSIDESIPGSVSIFTWDGNEWLQRGLVLTGEHLGDQFGSIVSISDDGNTIAVGARLNDDLAERSGSVYVYYWDGKAWVQKGTDLDGAIQNDLTGSHISLSNDGNTLAVRSNGKSDPGGITGTVNVYYWEDGKWIQKGWPLYGLLFENFGNSFSLTNNGNTIAIGATGNDDAGDYAGVVKIYDYVDIDWIQRGANIPGDGDFDFSGWSVSMNADGNQVAIGAIGSNIGGIYAGRVRIYYWDGNNWTRKGNDLIGKSPDQLGWSVSMSADGNTLAIGAYPDDLKWFYLGYVKIYTWNGFDWQQQGNTIFGDDLADGTGNAINLSDDGTTLALGIPLDNTGGLAAGKTRIYKYEFASNVVENVNQTISIYPNPTRDILYCTFEHGEYPDLSLTLLDATGNKVLEVAPTEKSLNIHFLPAGLYFLQIQKGVHEVHKIIKY